jgi:translation initiation factor 2 alpha subunit (eIF-2alpha)
MFGVAMKINEQWNTFSEKKRSFKEYRFSDDESSPIERGEMLAWIEHLYESWGWDLYENCGLDHALDAMRVALQDPEIIFSKINISEEHKNQLLETLRRKLGVVQFKIRVDFSVTSTGCDGIETIREAMLTAKHEVNDETWNLEFKIISSPRYKVEVITNNRQEGEAKLKQALIVIKRVMKANNGTFR